MTLNSYILGVLTPLIMGICIYFGWPHGSKHKLILLCQWLPVIGLLFTSYCYMKEYEHNLIDDYPASILYHAGGMVATYLLYVINFVVVYK